MEDEIFEKFKANCQISHLFYVLETFYNLETAIDFFSVKKNKNSSIERHDSLNCLFIQKHIVHFHDLLQIRNEIFDIISSVILLYVSDEILKKEIQILIQFLSKKLIGPSFKDFFALLKKILIKHLSKSHIFNLVPFEEVLLNILSLLKENSFKIASIKEVIDVENYNKSQNLDEFLSSLIELILIFVWEKKDPKCKIVKAIDSLLPKNLYPLTTQLLFEAIDKFKNMPAHFKLIEILFKRLEFLENEKVFSILQYIKYEMQSSEEAIKYFVRKKILRFYAKSLLLSDKITGAILSDINDFIINYIVDGKINSAIPFQEYITYNQHAFFNRMIQHLSKSLQKYVGDKNLCHFVEKKEKIVLISNFIQFLYIIEDILPNILGLNPQAIDTKNLVECLFLIFEMLKITKMCYLTLPEIVSFPHLNKENKELWGSICEPPNEFYFKNGGTLLSLSNMVVKILKFFLKYKNLDQAYKVVRILRSVYLLDKVPKTKAAKLKENFNPLKGLIEESNIKFQKFFIKNLDNFVENNFFLPLNKKNENLLKNPETSTNKTNENDLVFFYYLLYKIFKLIYFANNQPMILKEIFLIISKIFRFTGKEFLLEISSQQKYFTKIFEENNIKKIYNKENFFKFCSELYEIRNFYSEPKKNQLNNMKKLRSEEEIGLKEKNNEKVIETLIKNDIDSLNNNDVDYILNELVPRLNFSFKKTLFFVSF